MLAGCTTRPEAGIVAASGIRTDIECETAEGITRVSFCGLVLSPQAADSLSAHLHLAPLKVPERHGKVTNQIALPFECQLLHFSTPQATTLSGVFDSPYVLHDPESGVQFASVVLARSPLTGKSCLTFVRDFGHATPG